MKLSATMLNYLGYQYEQGEYNGQYFGSDAVAFITNFGLAAALKNGLLKPATYTFDLPKDPKMFLPGMPYGSTITGHALTALGIELGKTFGIKYRAIDWPWSSDPEERKAAYEKGKAEQAAVVKEAQTWLNQRMKEAA